MRRLVAVAGLLAALLPSGASAQIFVGLRAGYALPRGDFETGRPLEDRVRFQLPVTLDLGLRIGPALAVGAYASYAPARLPAGWQRDCDARGSTCGAAANRIGAQLNLHAANTEGTELWGGLAAGYAELRAKDSAGTIPELTYKGYDATVQGGLDFRLSRSLRLGPFASVTVGRFDRVAAFAEADVTDKALHAWLQLGLRAMFGD